MNKPTLFTSPASRLRRSRGFTLAETMISLVVLVIMFSTLRMGFYVLLRRKVVDRAVYNVEQEQESAANIITGLFKITTVIQLYPDENTFENQGPNGIQTSGNFAVLLDDNAAIIACFEYVPQTHTLNIYRGDTPDNVDPLILTQNISILARPGFPDAMFRLTDGLPQANWTAFGRFERYDAYVLGVPLRMR